MTISTYSEGTELQRGKPGGGAPEGFLPVILCEVFWATFPLFSLHLGFLTHTVRHETTQLHLLILIPARSRTRLTP